MTYGSVYEITNPLTKVAGQHMIEWFGYKDYDSYRWGFENIAGTGGSFTISDQYWDAGAKLLTGTSASNNVQIDFHNSTGMKNQYSHTGSKAIGVIKKETATQAFMDGGFKNGYGDDNNQLSFCHITNHTGGDIGIYLQTTSTVTSTGVAEDEEWHSYEIELKPSNNSMKLDGVLRAVSTTNLPTTNMSPAFKLLTRVGSAAEGRVRYCEVFNT